MLGKTINEKQKHRREDQQLAEALHLIWGLNHYPNYLYRQPVSGWARFVILMNYDQVHAIEELERKLEHQLSQLRAQKSQMMVVERISMDFLSAHESPFTKDTLCSALLDDEILTLLTVGNVPIGRITDIILI